MDPRIRPVLDALDASAREMRQHADWMQGLLSRTYTLWAQPGEYEANMMAIQATREHADLMQQRIETIERAWLEPGDHSRACGDRFCGALCRFREPLPVVASRLPSAAPQVAQKKPEEAEPKLERFSLIELE